MSWSSFQVTLHCLSTIHNLLTPLGLHLVVHLTLTTVPTTSCRTYCRRRANNRVNSEHHPLRWRATIQRRGVTSETLLILSTRRRHWLVADVTAPIPCRRVWPVAASTLCRLLGSAAVALISLTTRRRQGGQVSRHRDAACYAVWLRCTF